MNQKVNKIYKCEKCNKNYSSNSSLCNHNKKFHNIKLIKNNESQNIITKSIENSNNQYNCHYCNKTYIHFQSRWKHEKTCKVIINKKEELEKIKEENKQQELLLQIKKEEATILRLKLKLENSNKIDNITLKKLNKLLMNRNNKIKNSFNITTNNQQIINNFQLIGFGKEEIVETLTNKDKKLIINSKYKSLEKLVEIVHCGKYNQFKNIIITNMKDNYMYKYDDKIGHFVLSTKPDVLNSLIDYRLDDLEVIYNDLLEANKLDEITKDIIEKFINKINYHDSKYTDSEGILYDNYKQDMFISCLFILSYRKNKIYKQLINIPNI